MHVRRFCRRSPGPGAVFIRRNYDNVLGDGVYCLMSSRCLGSGRARARTHSRTRDVLKIRITYAVRIGSGQRRGVHSITIVRPHLHTHTHTAQTLVRGHAGSADPVSGRLTGTCLTAFSTPSHAVYTFVYYARTRVLILYTTYLVDRRYTGGILTRPGITSSWAPSLSSSIYTYLSLYIHI